MKRIGRKLLCVVSLMSGALHAQAPDSEPRYWLKAGDEYPVCRDFLENLNAFPQDEPPMVCEQKIHSTHPEFGQPAWEELDIEASLELIYEAELLLRRFTPRGSFAPRFEDWEPRFRERISSGQANPRLRKAPFRVGENPAGTLVLYEPIANECAVGLVDDGLSSGPGGYLFALRAATGELETFGGTIGGAQQRSDVVIHGDQDFYVTTSEPDVEVIGEPRIVDGRLANDLREIYRIGLHPVRPILGGSGRYLIPSRCNFGTDIEQR